MLAIAIISSDNSKTPSNVLTFCPFDKVPSSDTCKTLSFNKSFQDLTNVPDSLYKPPLTFSNKARKFVVPLIIYESTSIISLPLIDQPRNS